jgi:hypothetical protein
MLILRDSEDILLSDLTNIYKISGHFYGCNKSAVISNFKICYMLGIEP